MVVGVEALQKVLLAFCHGNLMGGKEGYGSWLKLDVKFISEDSSTGQDSKVAKDALAVVTEAGCLDGGYLKLATKLVEDAGGPRHLHPRQ